VLLKTQSIIIKYTANKLSNQLHLKSCNDYEHHGLKQYEKNNNL